MTSSDMCLIRDEPVLSTMKQQGDVAKVKYCCKNRCFKHVYAGDTKISLHEIFFSLLLFQ